MTAIRALSKAAWNVAMIGVIGFGLSLLRQVWSGFWFAVGALLAARWAGVI